MRPGGSRHIHKSNHGYSANLEFFVQCLNDSPRNRRQLEYKKIYICSYPEFGGFFFLPVLRLNEFLIFIVPKESPNTSKYRFDRQFDTALCVHASFQPKQ